MRTFLKISGTIFLLLFFVVLWALQRVDHTPYFETEYYASTRLRLDSILNETVLASGALELGFGRVSMTPGLGAGEDDPASGHFKELPMAGYGSRKGSFAKGIHDSLFIKALALRVEGQLLVLIGSDILIVPPHISEGVGRLVNEQLGLRRDQLFFSATHTHSSVGAWSEGYVGKEFAGETNPRVSEWLIKRYSAAISLAVEDLQAGQIGSASFQAPALIKNRLVGDKGEKNSEFIFLVAKQNSGKSALLGSFDAHATTLGGDNMQLSADYPGYWQRKLENQGIHMALFFAGSVGSHSARSKGEEFEEARYIGEALADSVLKFMDSVELRDRIELSFLTLGMELPEFHIRISDGLRLNPALGGKLFPPIGEVCFQAARIDNLIWVTAPADFSGELALAIKREMHMQGYRALVSSFNGAYVGYIIPGKYYHLNAYESRLMSWFGPNMGPYSHEMICRMIIGLVAL